MKKKFRNFSIFLLVLISAISFSISISAKTVETKLGHAHKTWTIKFNKAIDESTVKNSIIVEDSMGKVINVTIQVSESAAKIEPPIAGYAPGEYTIKVLNNIKSVNDDSIKEAYEMKFVVEGDTNIPINKQAEYAINKYSSEGKYILNSVSKVKGKSVPNLISKWSMFDDDVFQTIDTAVHEECHHYQGSMTGSKYDHSDDTWVQNVSHIIDNKLQVVSHKDKDLFKTEEAGENIPKDLRTFRWEEYVSAGSEVTANQWGAYGLLKEFEAYYYGNKAAYDSYGYLLELPYSDENYFNYYSTLDGTAFYEFKFFTLRYLLYAKENNINTYNMIMNDSSYKTVFKYIHNNYKNYVEVEKPARVNEMIEYLKSIGKDASYTNDGVLFIDLRGAGSGSEVENIKKEMKKTEYQAILNELIK